MKFSIVIPVYNEGNNLNLLVKKINFYLKKYKYEIIIVDDSSNDDSKNILKKLKKKFKNIKVIFRKNKPRDLSKSCSEGFEIAKFDYILVMDGDLQHNPKYIPEMVLKFKKNKCDFVIGARNLIKKRVKSLSYFRQSSLHLGEGSSALSDAAGFGQLWVKDDAPNNLYFTDDTGQDIPITNNGVIANQKFFYTSSFFHGNSNAEFIPLAGGSTFEQASIIDFTIDDTNFIVPYDLKINTIYANVVKSSSGTANPGNTSLKLYKGGSAYSNAVTVDLSSVGFDTTNLHTVYTWDFSGETNTYDAGEVMQIEIDPTSTLQYVSITIAGEYT